MKERIRKIKLLKELAQGKKSVSDLNPNPLPRILIQSDENPDLYCDLSVSRGEPGKCYTTREMNELKGIERPQCFILLQSTKTNIPIANSESEIEL